MRHSCATLFLAVVLCGSTTYAGVDAPGDLIVLADGRKVHLLCEGDGKPTVVLEAGHAAWSIHWLDVARAVANETRICLYDRPGYGWSDPGPLPRDIYANAKDLHRTLAASDETGPFVIAGHSYGGLSAMAFAQTYPEDVYALLLLDSAHPEQNSRLPPELIAPLRDFVTYWWKTAALIATGVSTPEVQGNPLLTGPAIAWEQWSLSRPHTYATMASELEQFDASIGILARTSEVLRDTRMLVLTARNSFDWFSQGSDAPMFRDAALRWPELQRELLHLSENSAQQFSNGNHALQFSDPDGVVRAIHGLVTLYRGEISNIGALAGSAD